MGQVNKKHSSRFALTASAVFFLAMHLGSIYVWMRLRREISPTFKEGKAGISRGITLSGEADSFWGNSILYSSTTLQNNDHKGE